MNKKFTVTKQIKFAAAHRLLEHGGDCNNLHGHNYTVELTFGADQLNSDSMVIDFKTIKERVGNWIMKWWDHATILNPNDDSIITFCMEEEMKRYLMSEGDPTAENMCKEIMGLNTLLEKVRIWETDTSYAELTNDNDCNCGR